MSIKLKERLNTPVRIDPLLVDAFERIDVLNPSSVRRQDIAMLRWLRYPVEDVEHRTALFGHILIGEYANAVESRKRAKRGIPSLKGYTVVDAAMRLTSSELDNMAWLSSRLFTTWHRMVATSVALDLRMGRDVMHVRNTNVELDDAFDALTVAVCTAIGWRVDERLNDHR